MFVCVYVCMYMCARVHVFVSLCACIFLSFSIAFCASPTGCGQYIAELATMWRTTKDIEVLTE